MRGHNLEQGACVEVECQVMQAGACVVDMAKLRAALKTAGMRTAADSLVINGGEAGNGCRMVGNTTTAAIDGFPTDEYRAGLPSPGGDFVGLPLSVDAAELREAFARVISATDCESSRYALGGVRLELAASTDGPRLSIVATDGRRLHLVELAADGYFDEADAIAFNSDNVIVPVAALKAMAKLLPGGRARESYRVEFRRTASEAEFRGPGWRFASRLVEGRYPRWRDVVPSRLDSTLVEFRAGELRAGVEALAAWKNEERRGADVAIYSEGGGVLHGERCGTRVTVPAAAYNARGAYPAEDIPRKYPAQPSELVAITIDPIFLREFLAPLAAGDSVEMDLADPNAPVVLRSASLGYTAVVMPLARDKERAAGGKWNLPGPGAPSEREAEPLAAEPEAEPLAAVAEPVAAQPPAEFTPPADYAAELRGYVARLGLLSALAKQAPRDSAELAAQARALQRGAEALAELAGLLLGAVEQGALARVDREAGATAGPAAIMSAPVQITGRNPADVLSDLAEVAALQAGAGEPFDVPASEGLYVPSAPIEAEAEAEAEPLSVGAPDYAPAPF